MAVALVAFEIMAQALFLGREGVLLSQYEPGGRAQAENRLDTFDRRVGLPGIRLHPLFGWANSPGTPGYNRQGFLSDVGFPLAASEDDFVVGVFGGSVASNFWSHNSAHGVFQTALRDAVGDLEGRRIVLLNFAKEAYRQPQQLAVLNYFAVSGQRFDLVLNIEGYNEITGGWANSINGVDMAMPVASLLFEFAQLTGADGLGAASANALTVRNLQARATEQTLASAWIALLGLSKIVELAGSTGPTAAENTYDSSSNLLFIGQSDVTNDRGKYLDLFVEYWRRATVLTASAAETTGASYVQVLQPNQYVATSRVFGAEEREIAFTDRNAYDGLINDAYKRLRQEVTRLPLGVTVVDASASLDDIPDIVYADNCCHLNDRGRDALARFVAESVAEQLKRDR
ncbi:MAG: hypothetical protein JJ899_10580 [Alphaproteobacteria bacterium]|nr:hypothetical protein [Alphaproteobacteria bacterium]